MSFSAYNLFQLIWIGILYVTLTLILPAIVLYPKTKNKPGEARFLIYLTTGNFYWMNLVAILELLHIAYGIVLWLVMFLTLFICCCLTRGYEPLWVFQQFLEYMRRVFSGVMGLRRFFLVCRTWIFRQIKKGAGHFVKTVLCRLPQWIFLLLVSAVAVYYMGTDQQVNYGYHWSDMLVHNYWMNGLGENTIYVAGIYPMGFHCTLYPIHAMFGVATAAILRHFSIIMYLMVIWVTFAVMRGLFKTRLAAFAGLFCFVNVVLWGINSYARYSGALPQEFGMLFLLPCVYFALEFLKARAPGRKRKEKQDAKQGTPPDDEQENKILVINDVLDLNLDEDAAAGQSKPQIPEQRKLPALRKLKASFKEWKIRRHTQKELKKLDQLEKIRRRENKHTEKELRKLEKVERLHEKEAAKEAAKEKKGRLVTLEEKEAEDEKKHLTKRKRFVQWVRRILLSFKREENLLLLFFALNFSMTISAHFYITIYAVVFFVAIAIACAFTVFRLGTLKKLIAACFLGFFLAAYPMVIAYAGGTPLQGSLTWALEVISGSSYTDSSGTVSDEIEEEDEDTEDTEEATADTTEEQVEARLELIETYTDQLQNNSELTDEERERLTTTLNLLIDEQESYEESSGTESETDWDSLRDVELEEEETSISLTELIGGLKEKIISLKDSLYLVCEANFETYLFSATAMNELDLFGEGASVYLVWGLIAGILILSILCRIFDNHYGRIGMVFALYLAFVVLMSCADNMGWPTIMENYRIVIFLVYGLAFNIALVIDQVSFLFMGHFRWKVTKYMTELVPLALTGAIVLTFLGRGIYTTPYAKQAFQSNGAIICQESIRNNESDFTWTIVSCNDEQRMMSDYGYHTECITLLEEIEDSDSEFYIPTGTIFVFVEKIPINYNYTSGYEGSGQSISEEGAAMDLPDSSSISCYTEENRWIVMSKMYYWVQAFQELYPNNVSVYYESDEFVCYEITQNINQLYNLAIDYGYN